MKRWQSLAACIGVVSTYLVLHLVAQAEASGHRVVQGTLTKIGPQTIFLKQNKKTMVFHLAPDTEIWRRGVYLEDPRQLVLGEDIRATYRKVGTDGVPIVDLVVASEAGDTVMMVPHEVVEYRFCAGVLAEVTKNSVVLQAGDGKRCILRVKKQTEIWDGQPGHDAGVLRPGDYVSSLNLVLYPQGELVAEKIWVETQVQRFG